jgi:hypothetical protein
MKSIPRAKLGEPGTVSPKAWNALADIVEETAKKVSQIQPKSSGDIIHRASPTGFTSHLTRRGGKGTGAGIKKLTIKQGTAANKFQIVPGTVNGQMPTLSGVALNNATPPEITVTADTWVWIKCVGTFGTPDTYVVTIETSATDAVPAGTEITATGFTAYRGLARVDFTAGSPAAYEIVPSYSGGDMGVDSYGTVIHFWKQ